MSAVLKLPFFGLGKARGFSVRPMVEGDLEAVLEIERACYQFPWSEGVYRDCLRVGYCCWVAERKFKIGGYGVMSVDAREAHILNLCIRPDWQGKGLGRVLLDRLLAVAREHHAETIFLEVRPSNQAAIKLYQRAGFTEAGVRKNYYPAANGRENAIVLALDLV